MTATDAFLKPQLNELHLFGQMFDELDHGVMLFSVSGGIHYLNHLADEALKHGGSLRRKENQIVVDSNELLRWNDALRHASKGNRQLVLLGQGAHALSIAIMPLDSYLRDSGAGLLLAIFGKQRLCEQLTLLAYGRAHNLTTSEQIVLEKMAEGGSPVEIARELHLAESTIRSHTKAILSKTMATSMRDLLITLTKLPPIQPRIKATASLQL